jgi:hypothetical protein
MFVFDIDGMRVVNTGDFRFDPSFRADPVLLSKPVDMLYYDDTFENVEVPLPTLAATQHTLQDTVKKLQADRTDFYINAAVLGLEPLLRRLSHDTGTTFVLGKSLSRTRCNQLRHLLGGTVVEASAPTTEPTRNIVLGDRAHEDAVRHAVVLSCTFFLLGLDAASTDEGKPVSRVWYSTHSNQAELARFKCLLAPRETVACELTAVPS